MRRMVSNAVAEMDAPGNIMPSRDKSNEKIDGVVAWCDALFVWSQAEEPEEESVSSYEIGGGEDPYLSWNFLTRAIA